MSGVLERYARRAPLASYLAHDPVRLCHRYQDPRDRELVALLAALLAFGRVGAFLPAVEALLSRMGARPRRYVESFGPRRDRSFFSDFRLRLWKGDDLRCLLGSLKLLFKKHETLEEAFLSGACVGRGGSPLDGLPALPAAPDFAVHCARLWALSRSLRSADPGPWTGRSRPPRYYSMLLVDPAGGSACKRWHLFLRWVARPADGVDLGLWQRVQPRELVMPLDVHVGRISRLIGLRARLTLDWKAAEEVTRALRKIDPDDPLRFDLPLSHLGISAGCRGRYLPAVCEPCGIRRLCSVYQQR